MSISRGALGLCSLVLINLMTGVADAADWWFVPQERVNEDLVYVDKSSLERPGRGSRVSAWVWVVFKSDQPSEKGGYRSEKRHLIVDCDQSLASADAIFRYSAFGGLVSQSRNPIEALSQIEATSRDGVAYRFMCSGGKQPIRSIPVHEPNKDSEQRFWLKERENVAPASR